MDSPHHAIRLIPAPTVIEAAGNKPKLIEERRGTRFRVLFGQSERTSCHHDVVEGGEPSKRPGQLEHPQQAAKRELVWSEVLDRAAVQANGS